MPCLYLPLLQVPSLPALTSSCPEPAICVLLPENKKC